MTFCPEIAGRTCWQRHPITAQLIRWEEVEDYSHCGPPHYSFPRHFVRAAQTPRGGAATRYTREELLAIAGICLLFGAHWAELCYVYPHERASDSARYRYELRGPRALIPQSAPKRSKQRATKRRGGTTQ